MQVSKKRFEASNLPKWMLPLKYLKIHKPTTKLKSHQRKTQTNPVKITPSQIKFTCADMTKQKDQGITCS